MYSSKTFVFTLLASIALPLAGCGAAGDDPGADFGPSSGDTFAEPDGRPVATPPAGEPVDPADAVGYWSVSTEMLRTSGDWCGEFSECDLTLSSESLESSFRIEPDADGYVMRGKTVRLEAGYVRDAERVDGRIEVEADGRWCIVDSAGNERFFHARMRDGHLVVVYDTSEERNPLDYPTRETTAVAAEPPTFATGGRWAMAEYDTFDGKTIVPSACVQLGNQRWAMYRERVEIDEFGFVEQQRSRIIFSDASCESIAGLEAEQRTGYVSESEAGTMIATVARNGSAAERTSFRMQGDRMISESCGPEPSCSDQFTQVVLKHTAR